MLTGILCADPEFIRVRIQRYDRWLLQIVENFLERAASCEVYIPDCGPFNKAVWQWLRANSQADTREAIMMILLHHHVRPFRTRAALGHRNWQSLITDLKCESFDTVAPNVLATYFLHGKRRASSATVWRDMGYCGQASALSGSNPNNIFGAQQRMESH